MIIGGIPDTFTQATIIRILYFFGNTLDLEAYCGPDVLILYIR